MSHAPNALMPDRELAPRTDNAKRVVAGLRKVSRGVVLLAAGQAMVMGSGAVVLACVARVISAAAVGFLSLAQTLANYTMLTSDMGTRLIGARLAARHRDNCSALVLLIEHKRLALAVASVTIFCIYACFGPVPTGARFFLVLFVLSSFPYCFNLDWLYWGLERFAICAGGQIVRGLLYAGVSLLALATLSSGALNGIAGANAFGNVAAALVVYWYWRRSAGKSWHVEGNPELGQAASWRSVFTLGGANLVNLTFQSADVLLLGALRSATELGHYTAAYKILRIIFSAYYLATNAVYPIFARAQNLKELRRDVGLGLILSSSVGVAMAFALYLGAHRILLLIYGPKFGASEALLRVLALALPLELGSALLGVTLVSRGRDAAVGYGVGLAAAVNVGLNLLLVPRFGALGAAWVTVISYLVYFPALAVAAFICLWTRPKAVSAQFTRPRV